jgi:hypothetical protein
MPKPEKGWETQRRIGATPVRGFRRRSKQAPQPTREEIREKTDEYLRNGGKITKIVLEFEDKKISGRVVDSWLAGADSDIFGNNF